ncbi:hypothetical protein BJ508DRAFT_85313 [Ascobolus immersus RN42]|uniref:Uncharacterized protein n=1 Tax=Ascobolus immersus RN42 TaxID=1160509 RepID=A0A3N4HHN1_ASCIM|nr:hypothetical protein BJ508DRAFT_85313 [Ascobolus immersus RN42]
MLSLSSKVPRAQSSPINDKHMHSINETDSFETRLSLQNEAVTEEWKENLNAGTLLFSDYIELMIELLSNQKKVNNSNLHLFTSTNLYNKCKREHEWDRWDIKILSVSGVYLAAIQRSGVIEKAFVEAGSFGRLKEYVESIRVMEDVDRGLPEFLWFLAGQMGHLPGSFNAQDDVNATENSYHYVEWIFVTRTIPDPVNYRGRTSRPWDHHQLQHFTDLQNNLSRFGFFVGIALIYASAIPYAYGFDFAYTRSIVPAIEEYFTNFSSDYLLRQLSYRATLGLAREQQFLLIKMALEAAAGNIIRYLEACVLAAREGRKAPDGSDHLVGRGLFKFLLGLRSESVESRIWRHLQCMD